MVFDTAGNVINDAAVELGLEAVSDPFASTDPAMVQLVRMLKSVGRDLVRVHPWTHLQKTATVSVVAGTDNYALPSDAHRVIDQTQWNRTTQLPLGGPVPAQGWQLLKAVLAGGVVDLYFRVAGNRLYLHPVPTASATLAYEYISAWWVQTSSAPSTDTPSAITDTLWFDTHLLSRKLKLSWLEAKGFDTTAALADYQHALADSIGGDGAAPVLSLNRQPMGLWRPLDGQNNVPWTGFGT